MNHPPELGTSHSEMNLRGGAGIGNQMEVGKGVANREQQGRIRGVHLGSMYWIWMVTWDLGGGGVWGSR